MNCLNKDIEAIATTFGFDKVGFAKPFLSSQSLLYYNQLVESNSFGDMTYLAKNTFFRNNPLSLMPNAKSVIVLGINYFNNYENNNDFTISEYALLNQDYHIWFKKSLKLFANKLKEEYGCDTRISLDTSPVMEKPIAALSGIGWQGKHSCLVSRDYAGFLFLGFVFTNLNIQPNGYHKNHCGTCNKCIVACPTNAINNYKLTIEKCIAYYNIEHKGFIPEHIALKMGNRLFGCDDCLNACVWNKFAKQSTSSLFSYNTLLKNLKLKDILLLTEEDFLKIFNKTPIKRLGLNLLKRNALIVALNQGNKSCINLAKLFTKSEDSTLSQTAIWVLNKFNNNKV